MVGTPGPEVTGITDVLDVEHDDGAVKLELLVRATSESQARNRAELELSLEEGVVQALTGGSFTAVESEHIDDKRRNFVTDYKVVVLNGEWLQRNGPNF